MLASASWARRIISMFASTSLGRKRLTSAPALKNLSLALRRTTTRTPSSPSAAAPPALAPVGRGDRAGELAQDPDVVGFRGRVSQGDRPEGAVGGKPDGH